MNYLKTALVVDISNLYFATLQKHGCKRLQITDYVKYIESLGHILTYKIVYSRQKYDDAPNFVALLKANGFETHFGNTQWNVAMALRVADIAPNVDCLVLGTNYNESGRILGWAKEKGKITKCIAVNVPSFFKHFAECTEIPSNLFKGKDDTNSINETPNSAKLLELHTDSNSNDLECIS